MTVLQSLQMKQSEIRESIGKLLEQPDRSEEDRGKLDELTKKATGLEVEIRAAISIEGDPHGSNHRDPEQRGSGAGVIARRVIRQRDLHGCPGES